MKTVGLDPSTYTGMALVGDGEDRGKCVNFPDAKGFNRLFLLRAEVQRVLEIWEPKLVVVENYAFGFRNSLATVVGCGTIIRVVLFDLKLPWFEVSPTSLKKWVTGKGNAKKPDMAIAVKERWGFCSPSDDINDAYGLGQMGQLGEVELLKVNGVTKGEYSY